MKRWNVTVELPGRDVRDATIEAAGFRDAADQFRHMLGVDQNGGQVLVTPVDNPSNTKLVVFYRPRRGARLRVRYVGNGTDAAD